MDTTTLKVILLYSAIINYAILIVWFVAFTAAHDWLFGLHARWFKLTRESFDAIHYGGMAVYKIGALVLNVAPLLALVISGR